MSDEQTTNSARKLSVLRSDTAAGWYCEACGWFHIVPRLTSATDATAEAKAAFEAHDCKKHPRKR
jgi:hypothetical protein